MKYSAGGFVALAFLCAAAGGQGVISDVFSGSLVNPKVGAWAWYDVNGGLTADGGVIRLGAMRPAIVGEEKVRDKQGYWLEMEYVPSVGYPSVYRMLLTGPAKEPERKLAGEEDIATAGGKVQAQHYEVADDNGKIDVWVEKEPKRTTPPKPSKGKP